MSSVFQLATQLAREAIDLWIRQKHKEALHQAITAYATQYAGSGDDLDEALEAAAIEHLLSEENVDETGGCIGASFIMPLSYDTRSSQTYQQYVSSVAQVPVLLP